MSRKVKSVKYTHFSSIPLRKLLSSPQIPQQRQQTNNDKPIQSVLEDILQATHYNILSKEKVLENTHAINILLDQTVEEYFCFTNYSSHVQNLTCEDEPLPVSAPEAQLHKKHTDFQQRKSIKRKSSNYKMHYSQLQDWSKTIKKCKKERDLKRHCSNGSFLPLSQPQYRASQDNTEQIQQLLRRKKELFLEVTKDSRTMAKSKVISTQRKQKKQFFQNDFGQAAQMSFSEQLRKVNRLIPVEVKVQQGQSLALNLKKRSVVEYAFTSKKSRRRIDRNLGDTCVLIEQINENDNSVWSAVNKAHNDLKSVRIKDQVQNLPSAWKLPPVR